MLLVLFLLQAANVESGKCCRAVFLLLATNDVSGKFVELYSCY